MNGPKEFKIVGWSYSPLSGNDAKLYETSLMPPSSEAQIFHFIPTANFEVLLATKMLSLGRCDLLRGDASDGKLPEKNKIEHSEAVSALNSGYNIPIKTASPEEIFERVELMRKCTYAHCWFTGMPNDSNMWSKYGDEERGICIVSTVGALRSSLEESTGFEGFKIATAHYSEKLETAATIPLEISLFHKHVSFASEKEIRLLFAPQLSKGKCDFEPNRERARVPVNLSKLLLGIVFGKLLPEEKREQVRQQITDNIGRHIKFSNQS